MKSAILAGLVLCSLNSQVMANNAETQALASVDAAADGIKRLLQKDLAIYAEIPSCEGDMYSAILTLANGLVGITDQGNKLMTSRVFDYRTVAGWGLNKLAGEAMAKHCLPQARAVYLSIIETFTRSSYAAIRQRAQIGVDDVRALSAGK